MKINRQLLSQLLFALIPIIYYLLIWNELPETVPTHYNFRMEADDFHSKTFLLVALVLMGLINVFSAWSMNEGTSGHQEESFTNPLMISLSWIMTYFISLVMLMIVLMTKQYCTGGTIVNSEKIVFAILSLMFVFLGYKMKGIQPNSYFGIRTKWTMKNIEVWKSTHRYFSKIWMYFFGIFSLILLVIPEKMIVSLFVTIALLTAGYSFYYSQKIYQQLNQ